jgi:methyl-accepting chemotaxis protein
LLFRRVVAVLAMAFGFLGVVACILGVYAVWLAGSRLDHANDRVFAIIDRSLTAARDRVLGVQQRVQKFRLTTDEIGKLVRDWAAKQATERALSRLEIESKADLLAQKLQQANLWLETTNESLQGAQQLLETASSLGAPVDAASVDEVLGTLTSLRSRVQQAQATVEAVREFIANVDDVASAEERTSRAIRLVTRVIVTISEIDTRLGELAHRLSEVQASAGPLKAHTSNYIVGATSVGWLVFAWMAAGQVALCSFGWKTWRRRRESHGFW